LNVLIFNLRTDAADDTLGFTTGWINAIASHCEHVTVITMYAGVVAVAPNVEVLSVGKERGYSEPRRLLEFYRLVAKVLRQRRIDATFAHMAPLFAVLFAPIAKIRGIPVLLWYAHGHVPLMLRVAHRLVDECVASTREGFRLRSTKVSFVGQGIDTAAFTPPLETSPPYESTVLIIGRITPIKNLDEIVDGIALARERGVDLRVEVVGAALTPRDRTYEQQVRGRVQRRGLSDVFDFVGPVPFTEVAARYRRGGIFVNLCDSALDKAILESMASGCLPISRNSAFKEIASTNGLRDLVPEAGPEGFADCLLRVISLSASEKQALRQRLRDITVSDHSLDARGSDLVRRMRRLREERARG
jgi:glycosyltransferase involved in cell wall biosynthesis